MKTASKNIQPRDITAILMIALLLYMLCSCNTIKRAENKVLSNPASVDKIGKVWEQTHPCNNDSIVVSKSDTIVQHDTSYLLKEGKRILIKDTLYVYDTLLQRITTVKSIHDTIKISTVDNRRLDIIKNDLAETTTRLNDAKATIAQLRSEHNEPGTMLKYLMLALIKKWWFWLIALGSLAWIFRKRIPFL